MSEFLWFVNGVIAAPFLSILFDLTKKILINARKAQKDESQ